MLQDYLTLHGFAVRQAGSGAELDAAPRRGARPTS